MNEIAVVNPDRVIDSPVRQSSDRGDHSPTSLLPGKDTLAVVDQLASIVIASGEFKRFRNKEQAMMTMLKGNSLGIGFTDALEHVYVINGKAGISGQLMLRLIYERCPGGVVEFVRSDEKECIVNMGRPGQKPVPFSFSLEEASKAGLLKSKDGGKNFVWHAYTQDMLRWRAVARGARAIFTDCIQGCYLEDELRSGPDINSNVTKITYGEDGPEQEIVYDEGEAPVSKPVEAKAKPKPEKKTAQRRGFGQLKMRCQGLLRKYNHFTGQKLSYKAALSELMGEAIIPDDTEMTFRDWKSLEAKLEEKIDLIENANSGDEG